MAMVRMLALEQLELLIPGNLRRLLSMGSFDLALHSRSCTVRAPLPAGVQTFTFRVQDYIR